MLFQADKEDIDLGLFDGAFLQDIGDTKWSFERDQIDRFAV